MHFFTFLLLISLLLTAFLGVLVYMRNPQSTVNHMYVLLSFVVALTGLNNFFISLADSTEEVFSLLRLFIFPVTVHFYLLLTQQERILKQRILYGLLYLFPLAIMLLTDPKDLFFVNEADPGYGWSFYLKPGIIGSSMLFFILSLSILLILMGARYVYKSREHKQRIQAWFVLGGFVGSLLFPVVFDLTLPMLSIQVPQISSSVFLFGYCLIAIAIIRYDLFAATPESAAEDILRNITDTVILTDAYDKITFINKAGLNLFGYKSRDMLGHKIHEFIQGSHPSDALQEAEAYDAETINSRQGEVSVMVTKTPLYHGNEIFDGQAYVIKEITEISNLIRRLTESEGRYRLLFEKSPEGILLIRDLNNSISGNEAACTIFGFKSVEQLVSTPIITIIHPEDRAVVQQREMSRKSGQQEDNIGEVRICRSDGEVRSVEYLIHSLRLSGEDVLLVMFRDITESVLFHQKLADSERRYSMLVETSPDAISLLGKNMEILMVNSRLAELSGLPVTDIVGRDVRTFFGNTEVSRKILERMQASFQSGEIIELERQTWATSMGPRLFKITMVPIRNSTGEIDMMMTVSRDITRLEESEALVRRNEEIYRLFLENFQGIALRMNVHNKIEFLYGEVEQITAYPIDVFYQDVSRILRMVHREDRLPVLRTLNHLRHNPGEKAIIETRIMRRDGHVRYLRIYLQNIKTGSDGPGFIQAAMFDKTDYYDLQNKIITTIIETEDRERRRFAEDLHDELGPLLSSVRIYINLIQSKGPGQEKEREELITFAKQLLDDAVAQTKNISYNLMPEVLSQYGFLSSIKSYCRKANISERLKIEIQTQDITDEMRFDEKVEITLYRVAKELINNTMKHSGAKNILLRFYLHNGMPAMDYSDDGIGFDADQKLQTSATLGIRNIVHRIQSVNGTATFSSSPGKGMKVMIRL